MRWTLLLLVLAGCDSGPSLDGTWASEWRTDTTSGDLALRLDPDGTYVSWDATMTGSATADAQIELGTFTATGDRISFVPAQSSCPTSAAHSLSYSVGELTLATPDTVFERRAESPFAGMALRSGCTESGAFVPQAIR